MSEIPVWLAIVIVVFLIWGSTLTLLGCIGLVYFESFYERLHMPTLATSWGVGGVLIASMLYSSFYADRPVLHEILIAMFMVMTTPVTLMMLSQAALNRDNTEDWNELPETIVPNQPKFDLRKKADKTKEQKKGKDK